MWKHASLKTFLSHIGVRVISCCFSLIKMNQHHYMETYTTAASVKHCKTEAQRRAPTSVGRFGGVGLGVAPPPPDPALQPERAALVVEPSPLLEGAEQLVQRLREVRS